jgi:hypothetical protein
LTLATLLLQAVAGFDFDDDEVGESAPAGQPSFFSDGSESAASTVPVFHSIGASEPKERGSLYLRAGQQSHGKVTMRTSQAKLDPEGIDALKALAAAGGIYTVSVPSIMGKPDSPHVYASVSACALLASRFEETMVLTMSSTKDRVLALSYALPVVPAQCPGASLPRIAFDEVVFKTSATMDFPEEGPKPLGKVHDGSFLPPAAAAAAQRQAQGGPGGGAPLGEDGEPQPQPQQSFLRKYWMYILPVVIMMSLGGGEEGGGGKGK